MFKDSATQGKRLKDYLKKTLYRGEESLRQPSLKSNLTRHYTNQSYQGTSLEV
jgi:hypothetical protein